jgi:Uma2 family endonuclease
MEQLFSHNQVKTEFTVVLGGLVKTEGKGYLFSDDTLFSNPDADLSTEPDALFVSYDAVSSGRVRWVEGAEESYVEVEGSPDMVLEIVSKTSMRKDTATLRERYGRAGVREYWLVDARGVAAVRRPAPHARRLRRCRIKRGLAAVRGVWSGVSIRSANRPVRTSAMRFYSSLNGGHNVTPQTQP